jgi:SAM-dependent methyltransferase
VSTLASVDGDDLRAQLQRQWDRSGEGWARRRAEMQERVAPVSQWMVDAISPQPGQRLLELAAGPGDTGFLAAELVRPGGTLLCSDFSEPMLDAARARAAELGADNVEFAILHAESLSLDTASFDAVLCRWGYMLMADPGAALQETRRVLAPGGTVALAAWAGPEANPWVALIAGGVREALGAPAPDLDQPGMFHFSPPGRIEERLRDAGFGSVRVQALDFEQGFDSFEHWWEAMLDLGRPMADLMDQATPDQREQVRGRARASAQRFAGPDGALRFPARALMAAATA